MRNGLPGRVMVGVRLVSRMMRFELVSLDDRDADEDEDRARDQRPENSPEKHAMQVSPWNPEVAEDQSPDEHIVDAEAFLDEGAGDVLAARLPTELPPHDDSERQPAGDPDGRFERRLLGADLMGLLVDDQQVDQQERDEDSEQRAPMPQFDFEFCEVSTRLRFDGKHPVHGASRSRGEGEGSC
jgi:hypothetical protein